MQKKRKSNPNEAENLYKSASVVIAGTPVVMKCGLSSSLTCRAQSAQMRVTVHVSATMRERLCVNREYEFMFSSKGET